MRSYNLDIDGLYGTGNAICTFTGKYVDVGNPTPDMFCIEDIAHALSMQPRFGGHLKKFYSVAQHSINCSFDVPDEDSLAALLHDASEAYLCDIPSPIKKLLPDYKRIEHKLMTVIAEKFGFKYPLSPTVKDADKYFLEREWSVHKKNVGSQFDYMDHRAAEDLFLTLYNVLSTPIACVK